MVGKQIILAVTAIHRKGSNQLKHPTTDGKSSVSDKLLFNLYCLLIKHMAGCKTTYGQH